MSFLVQVLRLGNDIVLFFGQGLKAHGNEINGLGEATLAF